MRCEQEREGARVGRAEGGVALCEVRVPEAAADAADGARAGRQTAEGCSGRVGEDVGVGATVDLHAQGHAAASPPNLSRVDRRSVRQRTYA